MRVVAQVARPGLQHTDHPDLPTQKARIGGELLQGRRRTPEEEGVDATLLLASELAKLGWEGEDHQEVGHRQAQFLLLGVPVLGLPMLTGRTVTIATRVIVVTGVLFSLVMTWRFLHLVANFVAHVSSVSSTAPVRRCWVTF